MIIDTKGFGVIEWSDYVVSEFGGPIPRLDDEAKWKEWATNVIALPQVRSQLPPKPDGYEHWYDWADDFNKAVRY